MRNTPLKAFAKSSPAKHKAPVGDRGMVGSGSGYTYNQAYDHNSQGPTKDHYGDPHGPKPGTKIAKVAKKIASRIRNVELKKTN